MIQNITNEEIKRLSNIYGVDEIIVKAIALTADDELDRDRKLYQMNEPVSDDEIDDFKIHYMKQGVIAMFENYTSRLSLEIPCCEYKELSTKEFKEKCSGCPRNPELYVPVIVDSMFNNNLTMREAIIYYHEFLNIIETE